MYSAIKIATKQSKQAATKHYNQNQCWKGQHTSYDNKKVSEGSRENKSSRDQAREKKSWPLLKLSNVTNSYYCMHLV